MLPRACLIEKKYIVVYRPPVGLLIDHHYLSCLVAKEVGDNTKDLKAIYEILANLQYQDLITAKPKKPIGKYFYFQLIYNPFVEKFIEGEKAVLTDLVMC